jgi:predicted transcriptional regulator
VAYRKIEKPNQTITHRTNKKGNAQAMVKLNKTDQLVMNALKEGKELTLQELADETGETSKKVFKSLRKLFENELIETNARKYKLLAGAK